MADKDYTNADVETLYGAAVAYISRSGTKYKALPIAARDKTEKYYHDIMNGDGIMKKYTKDKGGHPSNPINGRLDGLFFLAIEDENRFSNFGVKRFFLPLANFLKGYVLYFSDFYCMFSNTPHYVQIVLAKPDSEADNLCKKFGLKVVETSKFFGGERGDGSVLIPSCIEKEYFKGKWNEVEKIRYEFMLCEDVDIGLYEREKGAQLKADLVRGYSSSKPTGLPNWKGCPHCDVIKERV